MQGRPRWAAAVAARSADYVVQIHPLEISRLALLDARLRPRRARPAQSSPHRITSIHPYTAIPGPASASFDRLEPSPSAPQMEPTYSPGEVELVPVLERHSVAAAEPSVDTIAQVEQDDIGLSSIGVTPSPEDTRPPARVKWPQDLGRHVSVKMASPQTLVDEGAQALLSDALAQHQMANAPLESRYFGPSAPSSETTSTRASSEDGNPDERMQLLREDMEIFVDPGETFGLPSISTKPADDVNKKAAWDLVRSYTSGRQGFMRRRKRGISKKEEAKDELNEKQGDEEEGGSPGYFESKVRRSENLGGDPASMGFSATNAGGTGGVLSSLMALQQTGLQSGTSTPGTSIVSSRASSVNGGYSSASDDEEEEREKFTLAQREKKRKNLWNVPATTVSGVGKVGKAVVGAAYSLATNKPATKKPAVVVTDAPVRPSPLNSFIASRTTMPMASPEITSADMSHSRTSSGQNSPGLYHPRRPKSVFGESVQQLKKLGEKVGLDLARPEAARSSAGVFGGLIASTVRLTLDQLAELTECRATLPASLLPLPLVWDLPPPVRATTFRATPLLFSRRSTGPPVHPSPLLGDLPTRSSRAPSRGPVRPRRSPRRPSPSPRLAHPPFSRVPESLDSRCISRTSISRTCSGRYRSTAAERHPTRTWLAVTISWDIKRRRRSARVASGRKRSGGESTRRRSGSRKRSLSWRMVRRPYRARRR